MSTNLSYVAHEADGVQTQYDLTFGYLSRSHIFVFVDGVLSSYRWVSGTRVQLNLAPDPGQTVKIQRLTDRVNRIVDFQDGTTLLSGDLNASDLQSFYILQEIADQLADGVLEGTIPIATASGSANGGFVTEQWINEQLESNAYSTQAYIQLLQQITDEEIARAQAIADEAAARAQAVSQEAQDRAAALTAEGMARAQDVLNLEQADLAAGQRLTTLEQTVDDPATGLSAKVATLETTTVDLENTKAEASVVTAIQSDLDDPTTGLKVRATSLEDRTTAVENGKADTSVTDLLDTEINDPTTGLKTRATSLENRATNLENGKAEASALTALTTRVDDAETAIVDEQTARSAADSAFTQQLNTQSSRIDGAEGDITSLETTVANETGVRVSQINAANTRIDGVETSVTDVTQQLATETQARIDDITQANAATEAAQADATNALSLVSTEQASRISEVSRLDAQFRSNVNSQNLLRNSKFSMDPEGYIGLPRGWQGWVSSSLTEIKRSSFDADRLVAYMNSPAGEANRGLLQQIYDIVPGQTYTLTAVVRRRGGSFTASGVHSTFRNSSGGGIGTNNLLFAADASLDGQTGAYKDGTVAFSKTITAPAGATELRVYPMAAWSGFGSNATGAQIDWYEISVTPVDASVQTGIDAKATADSNSQLIASETAARASELSAVRARLGGSANLLKYSTFEDVNSAGAADIDPLGWTGREYGGMSGSSQGVTGSSLGAANQPPGVRCLRFHQPQGENVGVSDFIYRGTGAEGAYKEIPVVPGERYIFSLYANSQNGTSMYGFLGFRDENINYLGEGDDKINTYRETSGSFGTASDLGQMQRIWVVATAPAGAKYVTPTIVKRPQGQGNQSFGFAALPMLEKAGPDQTFPSEYSPGVPAAADVQVMKDALATGSSSQARLFLGVNTANNEAFIEQYAGEGEGVWNGSKITFTADKFQFNGDVIVNGTITADNLQAGAASNGNGGEIVSQSTPGNGVWTTVASCTLTTIGGKVYIHGTCDVDVQQAAGQSGTLDAQVRLVRNSTQIRKRDAGGYTFAAGNQGGVAYYKKGPGDIVDLDQPAAGTYTYALQVYLYNGSAGSGHRRVKNRNITAIEFRR